VRIAHVIDRDDYQNAQLHPRDCRAAFIEFGHSRGGDDRMGNWWPAGARWQDAIRTEHTVRLLGIDLEAPDPAALAAHWARIIEVPVVNEAGAPALVFEDGSIRFVPGPAECLGSVRVQVRDVAKTLARAVACGQWVRDDSFHLGGVHFRVAA
jgi:hypothetical protein